MGAFGGNLLESKFFKVFVIILCLAAGIWLFSSILPPFIFGIGLAYFYYPLVKILNRHSVPVIISSFFLTITTYVASVALIILLIPFFQELYHLFSYKIIFYKKEFWHLVQPLLEKLFKETGITIQETADATVSEAARWATKVIVEVWKNGWALTRCFSTLFFGPIISFHLMNDWIKIKDRLKALIPLRWQNVVRYAFLEINSSLSNYLRGQIAVCGLLAIYYGAALGINSLKFGLTIGILTGFFSFIPYLGFLGGLLSACSLSIFQFGTLSNLLSILFVYASGHILEAIFLTPRLIGQKTGLHPIWVLFAIFACGALAGFGGILLALPLATIVAACWRIFRKNYVKSEFFKKNKPASAIATQP